MKKLPAGLFRATIYLLHFLAFHGAADVNHKNHILVQFLLGLGSKKWAK